MNSSIIAVDILPDNDGKLVMYGVPNKDTFHVVSGKLRIVLSKSIKIKQIIMKLKGKSEYSDWENQYSCINVLKLDQTLVERVTIPCGVSDLDFEFSVPGNIPQTYVTSFGLIRYKLVALVQPASLLAKYSRVERGIHFARHYLPCRRELLPAPPTKVYRGQRKEILKYELDIPTVICVNEKSLLIRVRLNSLCDQGRVKKISFDLIQSEKYRIQPTSQDLAEFSIDSTQLLGNVQLSGSSSTKRKRSHPIKSTILNIPHDDDTWNNPLIYNLPFSQYKHNRLSSNSNLSNLTRKNHLKSTIKSPLMKVRHKLKLVIYFENESEKRLELGFPVIVTTIPEEGDYLLYNGNDYAGLPSYDDALLDDSTTVGYSANNVYSRPHTPSSLMNSESEIYSDPPSRNQSRNNTRPSTPVNYSEDLRPTYPDYLSLSPNSNTTNNINNINNINNGSNIGNSSFLESQPPLRQKKSQRSFVQALGRLLLRSESSPNLRSSSPPPPPPPSSSTPSNNNNNSSTSNLSINHLNSSTNNNLNQIHDISSSSFLEIPHALPSRLRPMKSMSSLTSDKTSSTTLFLSSTTNNNNNPSRISDLYTRTGRASWYLTDEEDDISHSIPEIQSAPNSPRLRGADINFDTTTKNDSINDINNNNSSLPVPKLFLTGNNILSKEHRRSLSCDDNFTNTSSIYKGISLSSNNVEKNKKVYGLYLNNGSSSLVNLQSSSSSSSSTSAKKFKSITANINDDTDDELIDDLKEFGIDRYLNLENKNERIKLNGNKSLESGIININVTMPSPTL